MDVKIYIRFILGSDNTSKLKYAAYQSKRLYTSIYNRLIGYKFINLGAGNNAEMLGWWTDEYQSGFIIDEETCLPFSAQSIDFAYSSMFFEHLNNETAKNLFKEIFRVLKPGGCLRLVVPDFELYLDEYHKNNLNFFYDQNDKNFSTWASMGVPLDMEHLLVGMISSIHNLPHQLVHFQHLEDLYSTPPKVCYPFQHRLSGYYCGPAPELSTEIIKLKLRTLSPKNFIDWVLNETSKSKFQDITFNSWHKNRWDFEKIFYFASSAGFLKIEKSKYGDSPIQLPPEIEKPGHQKTGLYFNLYR